MAAIGYAALAALALGAGEDTLIPWAIEPIGSRAAVWSATVFAVYLLATYLCGSTTLTWRERAARESVD